MVATSPPVEIFCSYAHEDESWLRKLETHLSLLKRQGLISLWYDRLIVPGVDWTKSIDTHLETASVILLLVSADFLASDYCYGVEMKRALERQEAGEARVIPILVRPVEWTGAPFAHLQSLPTDAKPLASWRNKETAFADVAAGIRRVIVEELPQITASAPLAALPAIWNIPYPRNPFFLGRESELAQIHQRMQASQPMALRQPQAISGLGGIGKTQLALEYAYRFHQDYQVVLWARAESAEALTSSYIAIAALLQLPEREDRDQDIIQAVKIWLQTHCDWLLILDNADELTLLPDFLPPSLGGHLLLTTRVIATGRLARRMELETLSPEQGALLLLRRATLLDPFADLSQASQEERKLALQISQELGGLPLALDQAGAYLEETGTDLTDYWHLYQQRRATLLHQRQGLLADDHPASVATTWSLSFQKVEEKNPAAADLLRLCAFLDPDAIPEELLIAGASQLGSGLAPVAAEVILLNQAIAALRAYSLIRRDPKGKVLSVHRLVQAALQDEMGETEKVYWAKRAVLLVNAAFPETGPTTWVQCGQLLPHALQAARLIESYHISCLEAGRLLYETACYFEDCAWAFDAWQGITHKLDQVLEQSLGAEYLYLLDPVSKLLHLYDQEGFFDQSSYEQIKQDFLTLEQLWPPKNPPGLSGLSICTLVCHAQGKYEPTEQLFQRSLLILEQSLGPEHPYVIYPLTQLAYLYLKQGKSEEAARLYQRSLPILATHRERFADPRTVKALHCLAQFWEAQGDSEKPKI